MRRQLRFRKRRFALLLAVAFVWVAGTVHAQAPPSKVECANAYERAQEARAEGKLQRARAALVVCARKGCPGFVQADCATWLNEVELEQPSVVVAAIGAEGTEVVDVEVTFDGRTVASRLDGKAIAVDPGLHAFAFKHRGATLERKVLVRQGEKNRVLEVRFEPEEPAPAAEPSRDRGAALEARRDRWRWIAYAAGGVGTIGVATFATAGVLARSQEDRLAKTCGDTPEGCPRSDIRSVKRKNLVADVGLGTAAVGLSAGVALYLLSDRLAGAGERGANSVGLVPLPSGGIASVSGRF